MRGRKAEGGEPTIPRAGKTMGVNHVGLQLCSFSAGDRSCLFLWRAVIPTKMALYRTPETITMPKEDGMG